MTKVLTSLAQVSGDYEAVLCDLWGCFHNGIEPYDSAITALQDFRSQGGLVALFTNAPRQSGLVAAQLDAMGAPSDCYDIIVTSGEATLLAVNSEQFGGAFYYIGPEKDAAFLAAVKGEQAPLAEADYILCSGLLDDARETPADYQRVFDAGIERGLPFVSANPDVIVDKGTQRLYCAGALAQAYAEQGGASHSFGKPYAPIYELAVARLSELAGVEMLKERLLGIGDGPATDVKGAADFGIDGLFIAGGLGAETILTGDKTIDPSAQERFLSEYHAAPQYSLAFLA